MKANDITNEQIREYLLGRISSSEILLRIEDFLFEDDEFCERMEIVEDELINDFVFGKLNADDTKDFEKTLENNAQRKSKVFFTQKLKEKVNHKTTEQETSFFESIKAFFKQPIYVGAFALLLIALVSIIFLFNPKSNNELAELQNLYKTDRPFASRISDFEYAPFNATRSEKTDETNKNKLRLIENNLLEKVESKKDVASFHALGVFYLTQAKFEDAIKNLQKAVELEPLNSKYRNDLGTAYLEFAKNGKSEKRLENFARANEEFSQAFEQNPQFFESLFNKALVLEELNLPKQAEETWQQYLELDKNSEWTKEARKNLERLKSKETGFKTDEQIFDEFYKAFQNNDEKRFWQIHLETKGVFTGVSIHQQLTKKYLESLKAKDENQANEYLTALNKLGKMESDKHADFFFKDLAEYYKNVDENKIDKLLQAKSLMVEGVDLIKQTDYSGSIKKFRESKELFDEAENKIEANLAEFWVGEMLPDVNKIEESRIVLKSVIEEAENNNHKVLLPNSYLWFGVGFFRQSEYSKAINETKKGLKIAEEIEDVYQISRNSDSISEIFRDLGEFKTSAEFHGKSMFNKNSTYSSKAQIWRILSSSSQIYNHLGFENTAVDGAKETLAFSRKHLSQTQAVNDSFDNLIAALIKKNHFDEASEFAEQSNQIALGRGEKSENYRIVADTFYTKGKVSLEKKDFEASLSDFEKSLDYYQKANDTAFNLFNVNIGKLQCLEMLKRNVEFQNTLSTTLKLIENLRQNIREDESRQAFFENAQVVYDLAIQDALNKRDFRQAYQFSEQSKARSLLDFISSEKSVNELESEFSDISKPLKIEDIQARMPLDALILQYVLLENKIGIWKITKENFEFVETKTEKSELDKNINDYYEAVISKENTEKLKPLAKNLYQLLIPKNLPNDKTICLVLDKSLNKIPFASLISENGKYFVENHKFIQSPSASVFIIATEKASNLEKTPNEKLLIFGNPRFNRLENPNLEDLPSAEIEANEIEKKFTEAQRFNGETALKAKFLDNFENYEIIHFAGHFVANSDSRKNSKLVFADDSLRVFELSKSKLRKSKLVVLSACQSGFENVNYSEGVIGIGRTFLALGSPLVVSSLWKVDSEATKDLMIAFHQKRKNEKLSSIEALRNAQIEILKTNNLKHPYYWSAFTMTGGLANY